MLSRALALLALASSLQSCVRYEYENEFWLHVDGSGTVYVTGRPELWTAFKGLAFGPRATDDALREGARKLFRDSGLRVRKITLTHRGGRPYLFVSADFTDVNALGGSPAFPDLRLSLKRAGDRLVLAGTWARPETAPSPPIDDTSGLMAIRFHLPSKVYEHKNATNGVERGNIVSWSQGLAPALRGDALAIGAVLDPRSILWSTVSHFLGAIVLALLILGTAVWLVARKGRVVRRG